MNRTETDEVTQLELGNGITVEPRADVEVVTPSEGSAEAEFMVFFRDLHHLRGSGPHRHPGALAHLTEILRKDHVFSLEAEAAGVRYVAYVQIGRGEYAIHGTAWPNWVKLRAAVSLGCIRMLNSDAIQVFNRIKVGTPVVITY